MAVSKKHIGVLVLVACGILIFLSLNSEKHVVCEIKGGLKDTGQEVSKGPQKRFFDLPLYDKFEYYAGGPELTGPSVAGMNAGEYDRRERAFFRYIHTEQFDCRNRVRGGLNEFADGGYEICLDPPFLTQKDCIIYSFGINNMWGFEEFAANTLGCVVHCFDPSMKQGDHLHSKNVHFYQVGLGGEDKEMDMGPNPPKGGPRHWKLKKMSTIMKELGHTQKNIDVVKMDIDYGEWDAFDNMFKEGILKQVKQLAMEWHMNDNAVPQLDKYSLTGPIVLNNFNTIYDLGFRIFYSRYNPSSRQVNKYTKRTIYFAQEVHYVNIKFCDNCKDAARESSSVIVI